MMKSKVEFCVHKLLCLPTYVFVERLFGRGERGQFCRESSIVVWRKAFYEGAKSFDAN